MELPLTGMNGFLALLAGCAVALLGLFIGAAGWAFGRYAKSRGRSWLPHIAGPSVALLINSLVLARSEIFHLIKGETLDRVGLPIALVSLVLWLLTTLGLHRFLKPASA